jgi:AraC-like DNA-binding protein
VQTPVLRSLLPVAVSFSCNNARAIHEKPCDGETLLLYCTRGTGWAEIGPRRYTINTGDMLVVPPREPRIYGAQTGNAWTFFSVRAIGTNLEFFLSQLGATSEQPLLKVGDDVRLLGWFTELLDMLQTDCGSAELIYASQTLAHLFSALICLQRENQRPDADVSRKIEDSISYMKQHLDEPLRAARLASIARMSLPHYFVLFKRETGCTPIDYFIHLRMQHARHLLAATAWSVKEVAAALGYEDPLYFSRVFKTINQVTPTQYRAKPSGGPLVNGEIAPETPIQVKLR